MKKLCITGISDIYVISIMTLAQTQYKTNRDKDLEKNLICILDLPASFKGIGNEFLIYLYA